MAPRLSLKFGNTATAISITFGTLAAVLTKAGIGSCFIKSQPSDAADQLQRTSKAGYPSPSFLVAVKSVGATLPVAEIPSSGDPMVVLFVIDHLSAYRLIRSVDR
jgi:hypothetical protein